MKILIVAPKYTKSVGEFYQFPLGLGYISAALKRAGHDVLCLNCNHTDEDPAQLIERTVRDFDPAVCATGALSPFLPQVKVIFSAARRAKPGVVNIAGGGVLSSDPEAGPLVMDIDVGVIGEGEDTVVDLCDALERGRDLAGVKGIVYRNAAGEITRTPTRDAIMDLGALAWPDFEGFGFGGVIDLQRPSDNYFFHTKDKPRSIDMITSRSCPYRCTFCFHPTGKVYRERPLDDFFRELDYRVEQHDINMVAVIDELFSLKKARLLEFCERMAPYKLEWMVQLHVNVADDHILESMKKAGCSYISYGIESMSQDVLYSMQKKSKKPRIDNVLQRTYDLKLGIQGNLIFGDSAETLQTANESMDWWATNRPYMVNVNRLQVYPGSPDYIEAVRDGLIRDRKGYIDSLFVDLNISKINDEDLGAMSTKLWTAQSTLLNVAPSTCFEEEPEPDAVRGPLHRIAWDCPRCAHHNDYRGVILSMPENRHAIRLTCRGCLSRFDIPNETRIRFEERHLKPTLDATFAEGMALLAEGKRSEGAKMLHDIARRSVWYYPAHVELGHYYVQKSAPLPAMRHYATAVQHNPYEPYCHVVYADAMLREGAVGMALQHYRQALLLDPDYAAAKTRLAEVEAGEWSEEDRARYFVSYSEGPIPQRLRGELVTCGKRKNEEEFPDIAKLEEEADTLMQTTGHRQVEDGSVAGDGVAEYAAA